MTASPAPTPSSATPILDRIIPLPPRLPVKAKAEKSRWVGPVAIIAVLVPLAWIYLMMHSVNVLQWSSKITPPIDRFLNRIGGELFVNGASESETVLRIFSLFPAILAILVVHELGHVIAGKLTGFRLLAMYFGPLQVTPPFHLKWLKKDPHPEAPASVSLLPIYSQRLRSRTIIMTLGGAAANFISALPVFFMPHPGVFKWFATLSVATGLHSLVPYTLRGDSDGKQILRLLRNPREQERAQAVLQLLTDVHNGTEPQNLDPGFLRLATAIQDNSMMTVYGHQLAYAPAYYKHDDAEAARLLEICLQYSNCAFPSMREFLFGSAVVFQATRRKRVDLARQWLAEIPEKPLIPGLRLHMEAVILQGEGDLQGALKKRDEAETVFRNSAEAKKRELTLRFFRRWGKELEEKLAATT